MPFRSTKLAKCPSCCPDGGAIFTVYGSAEWRCNNCGHTTPRRKNSPQPKVTASQQAVLTLLTRLGWTLETKFIGRGVWVVGRKDRGNATSNLILGDSFYGNIGVRGTFKLNLQRFGGDKVITDNAGAEVYLNW